MNAKEKAKELLETMYNADYLNISVYSAKQCALIAVDEIIKAFWNTNKNELEYRYWNEVKKEIKKL